MTVQSGTFHYNDWCGVLTTHHSVAEVDVQRERESVQGLGGYTNGGGTRRIGGFEGDPVHELRVYIL